MAPALFQPQDVQQLVQIPLIGPLAVQQQGKNHILLHRQLRDQVERLENKANVPAAEDGQRLFLHGEGVLFIDIDPPRGGGVQCSNHIQQCTFTGAGFPNDGYKFPFGNGEADVLQGVYRCFAAAIRFADVFYS